MKRQARLGCRLRPLLVLSSAALALPSMFSGIQTEEQLGDFEDEQDMGDSLDYSSFVAKGKKAAAPKTKKSSGVSKVTHEIFKTNTHDFLLRAIQRYPSLLTRKSPEGDTPLHLLAMHPLDKVDSLDKTVRLIDECLFKKVGVADRFRRSADIARLRANTLNKRRERPLESAISDRAPGMSTPRLVIALRLARHTKRPGIILRQAIKKWRNQTPQEEEEKIIPKEYEPQAAYNIVPPQLIYPQFFGGGFFQGFVPLYPNLPPFDFGGGEGPGGPSPSPPLTDPSAPRKLFEPSAPPMEYQQPIPIFLPFPYNPQRQQPTQPVEPPSPQFEAGGSKPIAAPRKIAPAKPKEEETTFQPQTSEIEDQPLDLPDVPVGEPKGPKGGPAPIFGETAPPKKPLRVQPETEGPTPASTSPTPASRSLRPPLDSIPPSSGSVLPASLRDASVPPRPSLPPPPPPPPPMPSFGPFPRFAGTVPGTYKKVIPPGRFPFEAIKEEEPEVELRRQSVKAGGEARGSKPAGFDEELASVLSNLGSFKKRGSGRRPKSEDFSTTMREEQPRRGSFGSSSRPLQELSREDFAQLASQAKEAAKKADDAGDVREYATELAKAVVADLELNDREALQAKFGGDSLLPLDLAGFEMRGGKTPSKGKRPASIIGRLVDSLDLPGRKFKLKSHSEILKEFEKIRPPKSNKVVDLVEFFHQGKFAKGQKGFFQKYPYDRYTPMSTTKKVPVPWKY